MKKLFYLFSLLALVSFSSCENGDWSFPDYGTTTVYFAYQYPVRTIVLGNDEVFDNTLDNQHKCLIKATMGGVYENQTSPVVDIEVVNSLCDNLKFSTGEDVVPMPAEYYTLSSDQKQKVQFELRQLLPAGGKVTYGRPALFCPLLSEHDFLRPAENCCLTFHAIKEALQNVLAVDFSAYYRDYIYTSPLLATTHEVLQHEILPDIILMPNIGTRGILWQEIEGHDRQTPASMLLPAICLSDIHLMMLRLTGEFRWEMCKRVQGARWNDVTDHSLTSEFFDYLQFYKKNCC